MVDEPVARVSRRRLVLAIGFTAIVVPLLAFGGFGLGSADSDAPTPVEPTVLAAPPPPKGISLAPTDPVAPEPEAGTEVEEPTTSDGSTLSTPTTRSVAPASTVPEIDETPDTDDPVPPPPPPSREARFEEGQASWAELIEGSCVHRTIAFQTTIRVTNTTTGASTTCVVLARGPYVSGRIVELDRSVFAELAPTTDEVITVRLEW